MSAPTPISAQGELFLGPCFICGASDAATCGHLERELVIWLYQQRAAAAAAAELPERRGPGRETGVAIARKAGA